MTNERHYESLLEGENAAYLEGLYENYLADPFSVNKSWRDYFATLPLPAELQQGVRHSQVQRQFTQPALFSKHCDGVIDGAEIERVVESERQQVHVLKLIEAYRVLGHLEANTNPLNDAYSQPKHKELTLSHYGLDHSDQQRIYDPGDFYIDHPSLKNIYRALRNTYTGSIGAEYMHIMDTEEKCWIQSKLESCESTPQCSDKEKIKLYEQLVAAETFERYLSIRYVGQKTFSLEGGESLIPLLHNLTQDAGEYGVKELALGMAHRGRLNVLVNILGKPPETLFKEFAGDVGHQGYAGDVKYHKGYSSNVETPSGAMRIGVAFNPSHLEIISPVVAGHVRARRDCRGKGKGDSILGVLIHGDAAFAGQGVVMETLNMSQTRGFSTHGTIHIVINNQIGFTTSTKVDSRSSYYPTDVAKMVNAPIFHVNGDDPEAVVFIAKLALEYRLRFRKDIVIDLVCYRRRGHNEADEPSLTQPNMYQAIASKLTTRILYGKKLIESSVLSSQSAEKAIKEYKSKMNKGKTLLTILETNSIPARYQVDWSIYKNRQWNEPVDTRVDKKKLKALAIQCFQQPNDFVVHNRLQKVLAGRLAMAAERQPVDWGFAENLAYASLLVEGYGVRLTGQDSGRGTFSHRHAIYHDQNSRRTWTPLKHLDKQQGLCTITDSLLSEEAVMAFEYGYATTDPKVLNIWEAQFGDFANGAQVVIDQFISSGEQKWGRLSGLTLFLPHGYEGMGAEHSSARLERYLQLCAQHNMQICIPSTPAQIYHLLRRQMVRNYRKPLITFTPKSLLRHPDVLSTLDELATGQFYTIIDDLSDASRVQRIIMCSGKVYYDLVKARNDAQLDSIAIIRLEQLYPFPKEDLKEIMARYPEQCEFVWCQEEPLNQGAWDGIKHRLRDFGDNLVCVSRPSSAAAAVGSYKTHQYEQHQLVQEAMVIAHKGEK
ncbi:MAG: 2-oxoglutarate dehydrogenase E1 component [Thiotrichaceae bacterium]|nr:2-oxoglutarate dehydrogenase E1 component [Thiotrichaceae bacterium]